MPRWCLLIHQLPPKPLYLRARIRQRLARVGAVALKNSVYVLPGSEDGIRELSEIAEEATAGGGEAFLCVAEFLGRPTDEEIEERFRRERAALYEEIKAQLRELLELARRGIGGNAANTGNAGGAVAGDLAARAGRLGKRLGEVSERDFFAAPERAGAEDLLLQLATFLEEKGGEARAPSAARRRQVAELAGRTWVTRKGVQVDRIASAWLIRRFIDSAARFRFADSQSPEATPGEIRFDTVGGEFSHEGDRCTFETLLARLDLADSGLSQIAEIVHDIDLKDGKFGRAEAAGVLQLIHGLALAHAEDRDRLDRGFALFDDLYESFRVRLPQATGISARLAGQGARIRRPKPPKET